jgi:hypothetical protein
VALSPCPDCSHLCSPLAPSCPNCGRPLGSDHGAQAFTNRSAPSGTVDPGPSVRSSTLYAGLALAAVLAALILVVAIRQTAALDPDAKNQRWAELDSLAWARESAKVRANAPPPLTVAQATARLDTAERLFRRKAPLDSIAPLLDFAVVGATQAVIDRRQATLTKLELRRQSQLEARAPAPAAAGAPDAASDAGYQSLVANIWPGKKLYLRLDKTFIGTVVNTEDDHTFDDGSQRDGVLVRYPDGSVDWLPRETVKRIYVTRP